MGCIKRKVNNYGLVKAHKIYVKVFEVKEASEEENSQSCQQD